MKKLLFFIGILAVSFAAFGQTYVGDKLPSGLTVTTSIQANDIQVVQKAGENYIKGIKAYHAYLYYKKMLDSIVNLSISGNLSVGGAANITGGFTVNGLSFFGQSANFYGTIGANNEVFFTDTIYISEIGYLDSYGYAMVLDTTDNIVKLAPMSGTTEQPDFNNVVFVNYDLPANVPAEHKFKSYADAVVWINTNGSPALNNHWTIVMPSGYCDEEIVADEFIDIQGHVGTVIKSVTSKIVFDGNNINDCTISGVIIDTLYGEADMILNVKNCRINHMEHSGSSGSSYFYEFTNNEILGTPEFDDLVFILGANKCNIFCQDLTSLPSIIINSLLNINGSVIGNETTFVLCGVFGDEITFNENTLFENCVIKFSNNIILNDFSKSVNSFVIADTVFINADLDFLSGALSGVKVFNSSDMNICGATMNSGDVIVNGTTLIRFYAGSSICAGSLILNDNCEIHYFPGFSIDGTIVNNDPTTTIIDHRSAYAEIYYADASTAQTIPTGTTYTKWTAFTSNGTYNQCTADASNDKITITEAGTYYVMGNFSSSSGTNSVVVKTALFVGGVEMAKINKIATFSTQNNAQSGSISGIITVAEDDVPVDIDIRVRHDNGGSVDLTGICGNLSVQKIGY